jgi:hypothetical protein
MNGLPFALSLSKGQPQAEKGFDKLSPNGEGAHSATLRRARDKREGAL